LTRSRHSEVAHTRFHLAIFVGTKVAAKDHAEFNPWTGEAIKIKASKKVAFRAAKELKLAV
jgi:nucleoid DNA-binding protein